MENLLNGIVFPIINFTAPEIGGVASIVKWLVGICSSVALGIILFTIVLKLITFPFDFFSRYSMRKNSVKMEEMRPELEKLQKQCADNKALYNQKMMALYKKNGYSMWGSCLPTILTLVIFIVAINGFSTYSSYQNKLYFYNMSQQYNSALYDEIDTDGNYIKYENNQIIVSSDIKNANGEKVKDAKGNEFVITCEENKNESGSVVGYKISTSTGDYVINCNSEFKVQNFTTKETDETKAKAIVDATKLIARERSAAKFREEKTSFLWVKNIWNTDSPLEHPVYKEWKTVNQGGCMSCFSCFGGTSDFATKQGYEVDDNFYDATGGNMDDTLYNELIFNLDEEVSVANGYFILCILSAGVTFLMQLVMSKSQKAQMELQTVNGQGAQQQKMMLWMMPIMMAFFSFLYTAAFSIYLILSSVISILTTFLINAIVDKKLGKNKKDSDKREVIRGRVYNKPVETKEDKKKTEKKPKVRDFIAGASDETSLRDRLK